MKGKLYLYLALLALVAYHLSSIQPSSLLWLELLELCFFKLVIYFVGTDSITITIIINRIGSTTNILIQVNGVQ